jgi:hypothetical protein
MPEKCKIVLDRTCSKLSYAGSIKVRCGIKHADYTDTWFQKTLPYSNILRIRFRRRGDEFLTNICLSIVGLYRLVRICVLRIYVLSLWF